MSAPLVAIEGLQRSFEPEPLRRLLRRKRAEPLHVLRGVDLTVDAGEWLGLIGDNGAGKTTLLKIIAGLILPSAGTVRVTGLEVASHGQAVRDAVGYVLADERSFHWRLTPRQNLRFFAALERLGSKEAEPRIEELLARLDLAENGDRPFYELSTGMRQRLAIARSLLRRPRVLLMDEPTRSVDAAHAEAVWPLVRAELEAVDGCAILVTHHREQAEAQCSRMTWLEQGTLRERPSAAPEPAAGIGLSVTVRGLRSELVQALGRFPGVGEIGVTRGRGGDDVLEISTPNGNFSLAAFVATLTDGGASVISLETYDEALPERPPAVDTEVAR